MKNTIARIKFKDHLGHANQFLVTSIVALHHLKESDINAAPEALHTTWSPKDRDGTISRSRIFIQQSFLAWAVDGIDMYVSLLNKSPKYIQKESEQLIFDKAGRSVYKKSINLGNELGINPVIIALLDVLITWRNNAVHALAENHILEENKIIIGNNMGYISNNFRGLDPTSLLKKAESGADLTFKETASLINVTHKYVEEVDKKIIENLNKEIFATHAIASEARNNMNFARKYSSLQGVKRQKMIKVWLQNNLSYSDPTLEVLEACCDIKVIEDINRKVKDATNVVPVDVL